MNTVDSFTLQEAQQLDKQDPLKSYRAQFHHPTQNDGTPFIYLCGNSLGLQPKDAAAAVQGELEAWRDLGVEGHFHGTNPWTTYHEYMAEAMAKVVGAKKEEVVMMNTLTVNLHLMLISFYRPLGERNKILVEADAFPSDKYAAASQIRHHGLIPEECLIEISARPGEVCLRHEDIQTKIEEYGDEIALVLFGNTNYYTGQFFDMKRITTWAHAKGCKIGFDCAHAAGNLPLNLHDSGCDFAVWCNYKYLNSGPGGMSGTFVHERHHNHPHIQRLEGWWGHNKETRFNMRGAFDPIPSAEAWQLSNQPILSMAPAWTSLKIFDKAGINEIRKKSIAITGYLEKLINSLGDEVVEIISPTNPEERGAQLSIKMKNSSKALFDRLTQDGVIVDWREPGVIRVAPAPLYNSYEDVFRFYEFLKKGIEAKL